MARRIRLPDLVHQPRQSLGKRYIESFIDKLRDECLNREVFGNGREAQAIVENWRQEYNNYQPHSSLDYLTPAEFARIYYEKNSNKRGWTIKGNDRHSLIIGGTKIRGTPPILFKNLNNIYRLILICLI